MANRGVPGRQPQQPARESPLGASGAGARGSRKPPIERLPTTICGNVIWPVSATNSSRPCGSLARLISLYATPRVCSSALACRRKPQGSVVQRTTPFSSGTGGPARYAGLSRGFATSCSTLAETTRRQSPAKRAALERLRGAPDGRPDGRPAVALTGHGDRPDRTLLRPKLPLDDVGIGPNAFVPRRGRAREGAGV
jgi:hypothetical protein